MPQYKDLITNFVRSWNFTRSETLEILESLGDENLQYKPAGSEKWQPLFFQFTCIGRTQLVYARAIREGVMDYSWFEDEDLPRKNDYRSIDSLKQLLEKADKEWTSAVRERRQDADFKISWPGFNQPLMNHISSLIAHERLHHGQLISYFTLAGFELPESFKSNWAL